MNHLLITFADGKQFAIPVRTLATLIAKYLAGHKRYGATYEEAYDAEFNYYRKNPEYLIPWASDMPWAKARRILGFPGISEAVIRGYRKEWGNAYKEIKNL